MSVIEKMAEVQMAESTREEESCKELKLVSELDGESILK